MQHCTHSSIAEGRITYVILLTIYDTSAVKEKSSKKSHV